MRKYETKRTIGGFEKGSQCWAVSPEAAAHALNCQSNIRNWQKPLTPADLVDITPEDGGEELESEK